jgi:predicted metal-dependent hydrolase
MELLTYRDRQVQLIPKRIKHCYFRVKLDGLIIVTYNKNMKRQIVLELLDKHWQLLEQRLNQQKNVEKYEQTLEHGSTIYYLGKQYNLEIIQNNQPKIELSENAAYLHTPNNDFAIKEKIFNKWYITQASAILSEHYQQYLPKVIHWNVSYPQLKFRKMTRRWGSFNKRTNTVTLNIHLIKASANLINYVIAHELCHTIHFNHSQDFYNLLSALHPSWRDDKKELNNYANKYLSC